MSSHSLAHLTLKQLKQAARLREKIDRLEAELNKVLSVGEAPAKASTSAKSTAKPAKRKRRMTAAGRARISAAAKARWAKRKASGKNRL